MGHGGHSHDYDLAYHAHRDVHAGDDRTGPGLATITVLLLCLQLQRIALGAVLVLCVSAGLAVTLVTLVTVGAPAAIGARKASNRWPWPGSAARPLIFPAR